MKTPGARVNSLCRATAIGAALTILFLLPGATPTEAADLKQVTIEAWDAYVRAVNLSEANHSAGESAFLWVDESPELGRRVRGGEVLVAGHDLRKVPGGLIHHWVGAMFLPNVTLDEVTRVLNDYNRYEEFYGPFVVKSKLLERTDDHERAFLLMTQKALGVTAAVETDDEIHIMKLDANRVYSLSSSVRVQEVANYGRQDERLLPEGQGPGYVWRTAGITRVEQRDGGVYLEMETIALSRGIPWEFRWLIKPLTEKLPRKIVFDTLNDTGVAVRREIESAPDRNQGISQNTALATNRH